MKLQSLTAWVDTGLQSTEVPDETLYQIPWLRDTDTDHRGRLFLEVRAYPTTEHDAETELRLALHEIKNRLQPPQGELPL